MNSLLIRFKWIVLLICLGLMTARLLAKEGLDKPQDQSATDYLIAINTPVNLNINQDAVSPIVIAIVDDGMRLSHEALQEFIWKNPNEIGDNRRDDDGNGFVDDVAGWDVSDQDADVRPPPGRQEHFYHGTHLAGLITSTLRRAYGEEASRHFKLMFVKAMSDNATDNYIKQGYQGIEYALAQNADIVLAAWNQAALSEHEEGVLKLAKEAGIPIIASAGNFPEGRAQYPAAYSDVIAVAAHDNEGKKLKQSNYGAFVDLTAPGAGLNSSSVSADDAYEQRSGTSQSAALVAAALAMLKHKYPSYSLVELTACLKQGSAYDSTFDDEMSGLTGSGRLDIGNALQCTLLTESTRQEIKLLQMPHAFLYFDQHQDREQNWNLTPNGNLNGIRFNVHVTGNLPDDLLVFYTNDETDEELASYSLNHLPKDFFLNANDIKAVIKPNPDAGWYARFKRKYFPENFRILIEYRVDPVDVTRKFCADTRYINQAGTLTDGSGESKYSPGSDCKWLISAPPGKRARIEFLNLNTQKNIDKIYFFNGTGTHEDVMAIFSGTQLPPVITTWGEQTLMWFVTDGELEGQGWEAKISFVDPE